MIRISEPKARPQPAFFGADDTAIGMDIGDVFATDAFTVITDRGAMVPLLHFWAAAVDLARWSFEPWEIEALAAWSGEPGRFVSLLREHGYLVPHGTQLRIAGDITEQTRLGCGLAAVMDSDLHTRVSCAQAIRSSLAAGGVA